ncbi:amino acid permease 8-like [Oryza glaberrima]|uniref:Amino acid transporter transmembrane domain-containing protein n=1 Tax=Oryza glaberrima TaxID=4538 RepID=I1Q0W1_ORYGL|nr:amino acid permease 8-like [Oryza glaberrima]
MASVDLELGRPLSAAAAAAYPPPLRRSINDDDVDDDGKPKRTGTEWTASAHIVTAVVGSGVLSLAWSTAQLGWVAGPATLVVFAVITYYTSVLLADCYRAGGDQVSGKRNYTYMDAVESYLGGRQVWFCGLCQYVNLVGTAIGYTITASISAAAVYKSNCFHKNGHSADCRVFTTSYMVVFGVVQVFFSQLQSLHEVAWLSVLAAVMSFSYSAIAVGLSLAQTISGPTGMTTMSGTVIGVDVDLSHKIWQALQALGNIAFAYSYSLVLIEIQDTIRSPPAESKTMRKANALAMPVITAFYTLCGCLGYAAFGNAAPGNMLTGFGFYDPYWLVGLANACIFVHLVGAYQVMSQPVFTAVESWASSRWPRCGFFVTGGGGTRLISVNAFRLAWRTAYVVACTAVAAVVPFFNDVLGLLGAVGFWPLTVYFPVEMYIRRRKLERSSKRWVALQSLNAVCFVVTLASAVASVQGIAESMAHYVPFKSKL